jgi:hypothetical protein
VKRLVEDGDGYWIGKVDTEIERVAAPSVETVDRVAISLERPQIPRALPHAALEGVPFVSGSIVRGRRAFYFSSVWENGVRAVQPYNKPDFPTKTMA